MPSGCWKQPRTWVIFCAMVAVVSGLWRTKHRASAGWRPQELQSGVWHSRFQVLHSCQMQAAFPAHQHVPEAVFWLVLMVNFPCTI